MRFVKILLTVATFALLGLCKAQTNPPTIALTFDAYATTYSAAFPIMRERGLVGTYFVDPDYVDRGDDLADALKPMHVTTSQLKEMQSDGWSIQGYTGQKMTSFLRTEGADITRKKLLGMKETMASKGFDITSIAAGGRAWSDELRDIASGLYSGVRANANFGRWQAYPVIDPLCVKNGATTSLSREDTPERLASQLDSLIESGGLWIVVAHKVGDDNDPGLSISDQTFAAFCDMLAAEVKAGRLRVVTFENALKLQ